LVAKPLVLLVLPHEALHHAGARRRTRVMPLQPLERRAGALEAGRSHEAIQNLPARPHRILARMGRGARFGTDADGGVARQRRDQARFPLVRVTDDGKRGGAHAITSSRSAATRREGSPSLASLSRHSLCCAGVAPTRPAPSSGSPTGRTTISAASPPIVSRRAFTKSTNSIRGGSQPLTTMSTSPGRGPCPAPSSRITAASCSRVASPPAA